MQASDIVGMLEAFLDNILNEDLVYPAEEVFQRFADVLAGTPDFDLIFREKRRFERNEFDTHTDYLNFNFLSFMWADNHLIRFRDIDEVNGRYDELTSNPNMVQIGEGKLVCFVSRQHLEEVSPIAKATARCLGAFYYTCGSHDHFASNVATRFVRDYFKEHRKFEINDIVTAIQEECGVRAAFLNVISSADESGIVADPTGLFEELNSDETFQGLLQLSLNKKVTLVGTTAKGINYVIHTLTHEYFDHSRPLIETAGRQEAPSEKRFAYAPRGIVVTACDTGKLKLDVLSFTPRIFRAYVNDQIFGAREEFFYGLLRDGGKLANQLLVEPAATNIDLREKIIPLLTKACDVLTKLTFASSVCVRSYDPFGQRLECIAEAHEEGIGGPVAAPIVPLSEANQFASARAFNSGIAVGMDEAKSSAGEDDNEMAEPTEFSQDFGDADGHVVSIPIIVGAMHLGTLDFFTNDRKFFANDRQYLHLAAEAIGELIRRIEASNDAALVIPPVISALCPSSAGAVPEGSLPPTTRHGGKAVRNSGIILIPAQHDAGHGFRPFCRKH